MMSDKAKADMDNQYFGSESDNNCVDINSSQSVLDSSIGRCGTVVRLLKKMVIFDIF